mmetsp:Transcript_67816/g.126686  ORF Transcript_67816/g.126686 Transcript_67816/m.126686 type:complete len:305 (+) Transcript_67816:63-977(+)
MDRFLVPAAACVGGAVLVAGAAATVKRKRAAEDEEQQLAAKRAKHAADTYESHITKHDGKGLVELSPGRLWHVTAEFCGCGPPWRRMIIYRPTGSTALLLLSPTAVDEPTMKAIEALGTVQYLIVPNPYHRTDSAVFKARYPKAQVVSPPGFVRQAVREVVEVDLTCMELAQLFPKTVKVIAIPGVSKCDAEMFEYAYEFSCADNTVAYAVTDSLLNFRDKSFMNWVFGSRGLASPDGCPIVGRITKWLVHSKAQMADFYRAQAKRDDVSMILMAHGDIFKGDTKAAFSAIADDLQPKCKVAGS